MSRASAVEYKYIKGNKSPSCWKQDAIKLTARLLASRRGSAANQSVQGAKVVGVSARRSRRDATV